MNANDRRYAGASPLQVADAPFGGLQAWLVGVILASYRIHPEAGDWVARFGADPGASNGEALRRWVARELEGWERELGALLLHRR